MARQGTEGGPCRRHSTEQKRFGDIGNPVQVEREPEEVESANAALVFDVVVGEGVETPEKEDGEAS